MARPSEPSKHLRPLLEKRQQFPQGQPIDAQGNGGPILGIAFLLLILIATGFSREDGCANKVVTDLPASRDIAGAQLHLNKGALRELHWHRVTEWAYVYQGRFRAHTLQGLDDQNEFLLAFDDGDFDATGTTFGVDDWITHTPRSILAKNFGVNESVFDTVPSKEPVISNGTIGSANVDSPNGMLDGNSSYVYKLSQVDVPRAPGGGGTLAKVDSRNFPIATRIAAAIVTLEPKGLRELHWHPNAEEWLYFHKGQARATVFLGGGLARTFDFRAGDTGVFPENSGHYIENISETEQLVWIELYKSDRVADVSLTQWLALTPPDIVASVLKIPRSVVDQLKKEKQVLVTGK
ncbi:MAG: hypothetical protein LQ339_005609 [Xanthoria mediterranea]|nr:MAG: hypothetical protein LQ339_005609 [Xanthoria mediterranea]